MSGKTRRRLIVVGLALVAASWLLGSPGPAWADEVRGNDTPPQGCQGSWELWRGSTSGWAAFRIRFKLTMFISGHPPFEHAPEADRSVLLGAWYSNSNTQHDAKYWYTSKEAGPAVFWGESFVQFQQWNQSSFRYAMAYPAHYIGSGCFVIEDVTVTRHASPPIGPSPGAGEPTPTPTAGPTSTPFESCGEVSVEDCPAPPSGHCWVNSWGQGDTFVAVPCEAPEEPPAAEPGTPDGCPVVRTGSLTWTVEFLGPAEVADRVCVLWAGYLSSGSGSYTFEWGDGEIWKQPSGIGSTVPNVMRGSLEGSSGEPPSHAVWGTSNITAVQFFSGGTANTSQGWKAVSSGSGSVGSLAAGRWHAIVICGNTRTQSGACSDTNGFPGGLRGTGGEGTTMTLTVTVTAGTWHIPEPTPSEGAPGWWQSPPPWWSDPPQGSGSSELDYVEICGPGSIASNRSACQTWPPPPPPGEGLEVCPEGSATLMCSELGEAVPTFEGRTPDPGGVAGLMEELDNREPFGTIAEAVDALDAAISGAAGSEPSWCLDLPFWGPEGGGSAEGACIPMGTVAGYVAPARTILLALLTIAVVVTLIKLRSQLTPAG